MNENIIEILLSRVRIWICFAGPTSAWPKTETWGMDDAEKMNRLFCTRRLKKVLITTIE